MSENVLVSQRSLALALGATTFVSAACVLHALRGGGSTAAADSFQADRPQPSVSDCAGPDSGGSEGLSVNYHFTRQCNYNCGFCFHTAKTSNHVPLEEAKRGLKMLHEAGMAKINFSGGEPFLIDGGRHLGEMCRFCKEVLRLESVTIVSNGSLITADWFAEYASFVDILAISCDSADDATNRAIGRVDRKNRDVPHKESLMRVRELCERYGVWFKLNTVVNSKNVNEDMSSLVSALRPKRWKVFQCLLIDGENQGADALRNAASFQISEEAFKEFVAAHDEQLALLGSDVRAVPESNTDMRNSYLILDERMRFLDNRTGAKIPSASILDVGVDEALKFSGFDEQAFRRRGGVYTWSRPQNLSW